MLMGAPPAPLIPDREVGTPIAGLVKAGRMEKLELSIPPGACGRVELPMP